jgi:hypothetical protein
MSMTTFSPRISPQTLQSIKSYWKGLYTAKTITLPHRISRRTETAPKNHWPVVNYWKAALYIANFSFATFLIRYGKLFSDGFTVPSSILVIGVFLLGGFTLLSRVSDGTRIKDYIKEHEAWALIALTIFMVAGTAFYVAYQSRLDGRTVESPKAAHS